MLFRYKIEECVAESIDRGFHGPAVGYRVTIQYYNPSAKLFKWRYFKTTKLYNVLTKLKHPTYKIETIDGLFDTLQQYNNIGEIMFKYIKKIMEDNDYKQYQKDVEDKVGNLVITNGWNTIEIKENE